MQSEELARYAVPLVGANDVVGALHDRERRDIVRAMTREQQVALMKSLNAGDDEGLITALLRSPVRFADLEKFARNGWNESIDNKDPIGRELLSIKKQSIDYSRRVITITAAMLKPMLNFTQQQLYVACKPQEGAELFGITPHEAASFERVLATRSA